MTLMPTRVGYVDWECPVCHSTMWIHHDDGDETEVRCRVCNNQMTAGEVRRGALASETPTQPMPPNDALWSIELATNFGPDYLWIEPAVRVDDTRAVVLVASETTDPINEWRETDVVLGIEELERLRDGIDRAIAWLTS